MTKSHNIVISYHLCVYLKPQLHGALFCNCFISRDMITPISMINVQFSTIFRASIGYAYFLVHAKLTVSANNKKTTTQPMTKQFLLNFSWKGRAYFKSSHFYSIQSCRNETIGPIYGTVGAAILNRLWNHNLQTSLANQLPFTGSCKALGECG